MRVLLLDITCPKPYSPRVLESEPLGGTEATVIRVAEELGKDREVYVIQHNREEAESRNAHYVPFGAVDHVAGNPDVTVAIRTTKLVPFARQQWNSKKLFLWCHDFSQNEIVEDFEALRGTGIKVLGVSQTHKTALADALLTRIKKPEGVTVDFVYNPVQLVPTDAPVNPYRLLYFSSPHKGLARTLEVFRLLRKAEPRFELRIANPGYLADFPISGEPGVTVLGSMPHSKVVEELRSALCVFHLNTVFPETFGLVYAEAMAVGTPSLAHPIGAVPEILGLNNGQLIDTRNTEAVVERVLLWSKQRPVVKGKADYQMDNVMNKWRALLDV